MPVRRRLAAAAAAAGAITALGLTVAPAVQASPSGSSPFINRFHHLTTIASTVPRNGDINPYGIFVIRQSTGRLHKGNVLISNFNNKANLQGTGTTIVQITPGGRRTLFAHLVASKLPGACPGGVGLTTALQVLPGGWVVVGSTPSANGMASTAKAGCLIVLNSVGKPVETLSGHGINGPWDATSFANSHFAALFVANVLNGTAAANGKVVFRGTVLRLGLVLHHFAPPTWVSSTKIASAYGTRTDPAAFVLGPTGLGLAHNGTLYVAETLSSRIFAVRNALFRSGSSGPGRSITHGGQLLQPLGLAIAPNGDILTVNGGNGKIVETTPAGMQVAAKFLDTSGGPPKGAGALFGLVVRPGGTGVYYVDDAVNTLRLLH